MMTKKNKANDNTMLMRKIITYTVVTLVIFLMAFVIYRNMVELRQIDFRNPSRKDRLFLMRFEP